MPDYRRNRIPEGSFFFTVNLRNRNSDALTRHIDILRRSIREVRERAWFHIDAWVVLPDHMHCVWTLPEGDDDFPERWRRIKASFSQARPLEGTPTAAMTERGDRGIWQRGYWEHTIRDDRDYATHVDYTHFNPVKHGYVVAPGDWPYSSFRRAVARGMYDPAWRGPSDGGLHPPYDHT